MENSGEVQVNTNDKENMIADADYLKNDLLRIMNKFRDEIEEINANETNNNELNTNDLNMNRIFDKFLCKSKYTVEPVVDHLSGTDVIYVNCDTADVLSENEESCAKRIRLDQETTDKNEVTSEPSADKNEAGLDDSIHFLHVKVPEPSGKPNQQTDLVTDQNEVLIRWRLKTVSDPKANLSITNYRLRLENDKNARQPTDRKFKPCIFIKAKCVTGGGAGGTHQRSNNYQQIPSMVTNRNTGGRFLSLSAMNPINGLYTDFSSNHPKVKQLANRTNESTTKTVECQQTDDERFLAKRSLEITTTYKALDKEAHLRFNEAKQSLYEVYMQQQSMIKYHFSQQIFTISNIFLLSNEMSQKMALLHNLYNRQLQYLQNSLSSECANLKTMCNEQISALKELHKSGKYQKGKLSEYVSMTVSQPASIRRKYKDTGIRQVLLTEHQLRNILIEDEIYLFYYGNPV
jgi:hypothetical protein